MKTKYFVQFGVLTSRGFEDGIGSDSVFILDGRNKLNTMLDDAINRYIKIKRVQPQFNAFQIRKGTFQNFINLTNEVTPMQ